MAITIKASDLTIRITVSQYTQTLDVGSGTTDVLVQSWTVWANKKNPSGNQIQTQAQPEWNYDTKFTVRYNRHFKSNFKVVDETGTWTINNVSIVDAGYKEWMILSCSKIDDDVS